MRCVCMQAGGSGQCGGRGAQAGQKADGEIEERSQTSFDINGGGGLVGGLKEKGARGTRKKHG